ncbi:MAG: hypothetical protein BWY76_02474 [bacterium ADurb.Bin429]|nr:MAG: hypothetical protein BWY76_02474 [bacterium ADurb.Bin429]
MNLAIHFDDHTGAVTVEVNNIFANNLLAAEVQAVKEISFQIAPKQAFFFRHPVTQSFRTSYHLRCNVLSSDNT